MSCTVNLLPVSCRNARRRTVRRNAWTALVLSIGLLVVGTWAALRAVDRSLQRLSHQFASAQSKQSELHRQWALATRLRHDLLQRGRTLSALRQEQFLPEQLLALTHQAPDGVVFTEISAQPATGGRPAARPVLQPAGLIANGQPGSHTALPQDPSATDQPLVVHMTGYAADHDQLARLIGVLQRVPRWERVELLGATREPYRSGVALAFRLECQPGESRR
jgi:hypothetical protein